MCCNDAPDYTPIANANAEAAARSDALAREEMAFRRQTYADLAPFIQAQLNQGLQTSAQQADAADEQMDVARDNIDYQREIFRPVELETVRDAMEYGDEVDQEEAASQALAQADQSYANTREATKMARESAGIDPSSGRTISSDRALDVAEAVGKTAAANNARTTVKDKGIALRSGVANFGRGMANTAAGAFSGAVGAGSASTANAGAGVGTALQGGQFAAQGFGAGQQAVGTQMQANAANAGLMTQSFNNTQTQLNNVGQLLGAGAQAYMMFSARGLKRPVAKVDGEKAREGLEAAPVEVWDYKEGVADGGRHVGPYADDMNKQFGDSVAPGGQQIDVISNLGVHHAAIADMSRELKKMKKIVGGLRRAEA